MDISGAPQAFGSISIERCEQLMRNHGIPAACLCPQPCRMVEGPSAGRHLDAASTSIRGRSSSMRPSRAWCTAGKAFRTTTAVSLLLQENADHFGILIDGVEGWCALGLPLEMPDTRVCSQNSTKL